MPTIPKSTGRRSFLKVAAASGFTLTFVMPEFSRVAEAECATATQVTAWLNIGSDETIVLTIGSSEMGQGSFTGLAQILAEDLMVDFARVKTVQGGPTVVVPAPVGASINTVGSSVVRTNFWRMRDAGAIAREMLVKAAMNAKGDQTRSNYSVSNGVVTHLSSGASMTYGSLASAAALLTPPASAPLVPDSQFRLIGKTVPRQDIPSKTDGSAKYGLDVQVPGMVYAVIKHCPTFGGTLASAPATPSGMLKVVPVQVIAGTGRGTEVTGAVNAVAVVGPNTWDVWRSAKSLRVTWNVPANAVLLNDAQFLAAAAALAASAPAYVAGAANPDRKSVV